MEFGPTIDDGWISVKLRSGRSKEVCVGGFGLIKVGPTIQLAVMCFFHTATIIIGIRRPKMFRWLSVNPRLSSH